MVNAARLNFFGSRCRRFTTSSFPTKYDNTCEPWFTNEARALRRIELQNAALRATAGKPSYLPRQPVWQQHIEPRANAYWPPE